MEDITGASASAAAGDAGGINSQPPSTRDGGNMNGGFAPSRRVTIGGMNRRSSLGIDPASMSELFGRRASGFGDLDIGPILSRRDSLDSTTAVLDAAIMDLTRRRLSMAVGTMPGDVNIPGGMGSLPDSLGGNMAGMNTMAGMSSTMNAMASMGNQLRASLSMPSGNKAAPPGSGLSSVGQGGVDSIAARQQQLQEQQRELERRQKELEIQRQQLIAGMEERRIAMQQMQQQMSQNSQNPSLSQMNGAAAVAAGALGSLGGASNNSLFLGRRMSNFGAGPQSSNGQQWHICQVCNAKAFASREEALQHEALCTAGPAGALRSDSLTPRRSSLLGHRGSLGFGSLFSHRGSLSFLSDLARLDSQQTQQQGQFSMGNQLGQDGFLGDADLALARRFSLSQPGEAAAAETKMSNGPFAMMPNPLPLAMACDKDWLTPLHCFVRRHCVQVFTATQTDVATPSKGKRKPIHVGQVGIRCPHCHHDEEAKARERGSVYYPTTIASIYNATMNLLQRHLHNCASVPEEIMRRYETLKADDARSGTSKKYWVESALSLGLVDTPNGIRFSALSPPPLPGLSHQQTSTGTSRTARRNSNDFFSSSSNAISDLSQRSEGATSVGAGDGHATGGQASLSVGPSLSQSGPAEKSGGSMIPETEQNLAQSAPLVTPDDEPFATAFSYHLLSQMQPCVFTDADRLGKRKGLPPGFPGLACRHCFGGYGSGRFFPSSIKTLSDTSKTLNVLHNHMMRCRKCPPEVRETLEKLRTTHDEERAKMKFGSQKAFFARIWDRLHKNDTSILRKGAPTASKRKMPPAAMGGGPNSAAAAMLAAAGAAGANFPGLAAGLEASALQNAKRRRTSN